MWLLKSEGESMDVEVSSDLLDLLSSAEEILGYYNDGLGITNQILSAANTIPSDGPTVVSRAITAVLNVMSGLVRNFVTPGRVHALPLTPKNFSNTDWAEYIQESLDDRYDNARPIYGKTSPVVGVLIIGTSPANVKQGTAVARLLKMVSLYTGLYGQTAAMFDGYTIPVPKRFKARTVVRPDDFSSYGGFVPPTPTKSLLAVKLQWQPRSQVKILGIGKVKVTAINVYRNDVEFPGEGDKLDLIQYLIHTQKYNLFNNELATILDPTVEEDTVYYYAVGYEIELEGEPYDRMILTHRVRIDTARPVSVSRVATIPRWSASSNPLKLSPATADAIILAENTINKHLTLGGSEPTPLDSQIGLITQMIADNERIIRELSAISTRLQSLTSISASVDTHVYPISVAGGTSDLATDINDALHSSDAPKLSSSQTSAGMLLVSGADNEEALASVKFLYSLVLGAQHTFNTSELVNKAKEVIQ